MTPVVYFQLQDGYLFRAVYAAWYKGVMLDSAIRVHGPIQCIVRVFPKPRFPSGGVMTYTQRAKHIEGEPVINKLFEEISNAELAKFISTLNYLKIPKECHKNIFPL